MRNLLLIGGVGHPFRATSADAASVLAAVGVDTDVVEPEGWEDALGVIARYDVLSFDALRWRMLPARYDHLRSENAYETTPRLRDAVEGHLGRGRPLFALHTSCICFDDWPRWGEVLGASFDWARSFHPALDDIELRVGEHTAAPTAGSAVPSAPAVSVFPDEVYHGLHVTDPGREVRAWARVAADAVAQHEPPLGAAGIGAWQPVVWCRREGASRILVDTLGHDVRSLGEPLHRRVLHDGLAWLVGRGE